MLNGGNTQLGQERLTRDAVAEAKQAKAGSPVAFDEHLRGLDAGDAVRNEAAHIPRWLRREELGELLPPRQATDGKGGRGAF